MVRVKITWNDQIGTSAVRKSRGYSENDHEKDATCDNAVVTNENDYVQTTFNKLIRLVKRWQQKLIDSLIGVRDACLSSSNKYVTNSSKG